MSRADKRAKRKYNELVTRLESLILSQMVDDLFNASVFLKEADENLFDKLDQEFVSAEEADENSEETKDDGIFKRKLIWLAVEYDRLSSKLLLRLKRDSRMLPVLDELNQVRELFRFFLANYKLFNDNERKQIITTLEEILRYFSEQLRKYLEQTEV